MRGSDATARIASMQNGVSYGRVNTDGRTAKCANVSWFTWVRRGARSAATAGTSSGWSTASTQTAEVSELQAGASGWEKDFVKCFLKVPLACLGSTAAAVQPNGLWNSKKTFYNTFFTA